MISSDLDRTSKFSVVNELRHSLAALKIGRTNLISMAELPVMKRAFFSGGNGLFDGEDANEFPCGGTLILGSNFGGYDNFCDSDGMLVCSNETDNPSSATWVGLKRRHTIAQLKDSFFTNAWPFLHPGSGNISNVGPWLKDEHVMSSCRKHFFVAFEKVQPTLIVSLGTGPAAFLGHAWPKDLSAWQGYKWDAIDRLPLAEFAINGNPIVCVALTHPSMSNAHHRKEPYKGRAGEARLLEEAYAKALPLRNKFVAAKAT